MIGIIYMRLRKSFIDSIDDDKIRKELKSIVRRYENLIQMNCVKVGNLYVTSENRLKRIIAYEKRVRGELRRISMQTGINFPPVGIRVVKIAPFERKIITVTYSNYSFDVNANEFVVSKEDLAFALKEHLVSFSKVVTRQRFKDSIGPEGIKSLLQEYRDIENFASELGIKTDFTPIYDFIKSLRRKVPSTAKDEFMRTIESINFYPGQVS